MKSSILWLVLVIVVGLIGVGAAFAFMVSGVWAGAGAWRVSFIRYSTEDYMTIRTTYLEIAAGFSLVLLLLASYVRQWRGWKAPGNILACAATVFWGMASLFAWLGPGEMMDFPYQSGYSNEVIVQLCSQLSGGAGGFGNIFFLLVYVAEHYLRVLLLPTVIFAAWSWARGTRAAGIAGLSFVVIYFALGMALPLVMIFFSTSFTSASFWSASSSWERLLELLDGLTRAVLMLMIMLPICLMKSKLGWSVVRWTGIGTAAAGTGLMIFSGVYRYFNPLRGSELALQMTISIVIVIWVGAGAFHAGLLAQVKPGHRWVR